MPEAQQHPVRGILLILSALFFFAALDATSKHLSQKFAVPLLVWARYTQTRQLSPIEGTFTMLFYTALVGTVVMTLGLPWYWDGPRPTLFETLLIASMGIYGGTGHYLLTRAFRHAPATTLTTFMYAQLIWATLLGWQVFDQLPDRWAVIGMTVIAGSGLAVALSERKK